MTRRTALHALGGALAAAPAVLSSARRRPNVVFFMTDDQRHDALGAAGNRFLKTPHMDRIAAGGIRFTQAFVTNSLCSPSRGTIVTGLYSHVHGVRTNGGGTHRLREDIPTFPGLLRESGYFTALAGKWHIASPPTGFDQTSILPGQGLYHDPILIVNGGRAQFRGYVDDIVAGQAIEMLKSRPKEKPFCLLCQFKAPHRSWEPAPRFNKALEGAVFPEPPTFGVSLADRPAAIRDSDIQIADMPDFESFGVPRSAPRQERKRRNYQLFLRQYYRTLMGVDENVGRVLDFLDREGLAQDTLVIHTSDNGFFHGEYGLFDKRMMYEPSIRVPLLARYPAGFPAGRTDASHMVLNNDIAHTILDFCGVERPASMRAHGESWRPLAEGRATPWRDAWMYEYFEYPAITCTGKMRGIRTNRWKLIHYIQEPQGWELFDLDHDPEERVNLYGRPEHRALAAELQARLRRMRTELGDDFSEDGLPAAPCTIRIANTPHR